MISARRRRQIRELDLFLAATPLSSGPILGTGDAAAFALYDEERGLVITRIEREDDAVGEAFRE